MSPLLIRPVLADMCSVIRTLSVYNVGSIDGPVHYTLFSSCKSGKADLSATKACLLGDMKRQIKGVSLFKITDSNVFGMSLKIERDL